MDVADLAFGDHFLGLLIKAIAAILRADLDHFAVLLGGFHHFLAFFNGVAQGLLDVDMLAGFERGEKHRSMEVFRGGDDDGVD